MENKLCLELIKFMHALKRENEKLCQQISLELFEKESAFTFGDFIFIDFLAKNLDRDIYQKDIEEFFDITAPTVSTKLRGLEKSGFISRVYSKKDSRLKAVILTEEGKDVANKIKDKHLSIEDKIAHSLPKEEYQELINSIKKLNTLI